MGKEFVNAVCYMSLKTSLIAAKRLRSADILAAAAWTSLDVWFSAGQVKPHLVNAAWRNTRSQSRGLSGRGQLAAARMAALRLRTWGPTSRRQFAQFMRALVRKKMISYQNFVFA